MGNSLLSQIGSSVMDAVAGTSSSPSLQNFLNGISSAHSNGIKIKQPDPLNTFSVKFKFFPTITVTPNQKSSGFFSNLASNVGNALVKGAKTAVKNTLNNLTGGLLGSLMNDINIKAEHDKFTTIRSPQESHTFIEYLAKANLLCGNEDTWFGGMGEITAPLEIDMTYFIQKITVPQLKIDGGAEEINTNYIGKFQMNGTYITPDSHNLMIEVLNTKVPVMERIFYPWMREVTLPYWSYSTQPYTTATITIDMTSHTDLRYIFIGCRPSQMQTIQPDQGLPSGMSRQVTFTFDYMFVGSDMTTTESLKSKLMSVGKSLFNSAAKSLRL